MPGSKANFLLQATLSVTGFENFRNKARRVRSPNGGSTFPVKRPSEPEIEDAESDSPSGYPRGSYRKFEGFACLATFKDHHAGISPTKARELIQQTDQIIRSFGEVHHVFGTVGRAETATDPAPMDMIETTIMFKPESKWPLVDFRNDKGELVAHRRRSVEELTSALNAAVQIPGLTNAWTMPIKTRIDMLATGIKTPVGIKVAGPDLATLERVGSEIETVLRKLPGTGSVFAERVLGGNYIEIDIDRDAIARHGLLIKDARDTIEAALGGMALTTTVEGLERYGVIVRYARDYRDNLDALNEISIPVRSGSAGASMGGSAPAPAAQIPLSQLAKLRVAAAPMGVKSEGAMPMVGGVVTSTLMELLGYPAIYYIWKSRELARSEKVEAAWHLQA